MTLDHLEHQVRRRKRAQPFRAILTHYCLTLFFVEVVKDDADSVPVLVLGEGLVVGWMVMLGRRYLRLARLN